MTSLPVPYYEDDSCTLYCADCRDILPKLDERPDDLFITDPPYGTGGWRRPEAGRGSDPRATLVIEAWDEGATDWLALHDVEAALVFWPAARTRHLLAAADDAGLTKHRAVYMQKPDPKPQVGGRIRWSIEPVWVLSRDGFSLYGGHDLCVAGTPRKGRDRAATGHPYEKPLIVMRWLIGKTKGGRIIDPFAGSGTTLVAGKALGRNVIGIEQDEAWCEIAARRLAQAVLPLEVAG